MSDKLSIRTNHYKLPYRPDIDGLRAIAVISVIIFHTFPRILKGGFVGVDIFFVISGYLISSIIISDLKTSNFSLKQFYIRRIKRIFPCLLLVLYATYIIGWITLFDFEYKQLSKHIIAGSTFTSNFTLLKESGYFDSTSETKPLLHLWSLAIEEQFYIIWPLLIYVILSRNINLTVCLVTAFITSFTLNLITINLNTSTAFYMPHTRFWELIIGSILAHIEINKPQITNYLKHRKFQSLTSAIGWALILISLFSIRKNHIFPGAIALLPTIGTALIIASGSTNFLSKILSNKIIVFIGLISFPLYLWHWPIISFLNIIYGHSQPIMYKVYAIATTFCLATLTFYFVEKPIRFHSRKFIPSILIIFIASIGVIGYYSVRSDGLPNRDANMHYLQSKYSLTRQANINEECKNYINNINPTFDYCMFHNAGSDHTIAIIGDSHAHTAYDGLYKALEQKTINTVLLSNSGCPSLIGAEYGDNSIKKEECRKKINDILSLITNKTDIKTVLIFARSTLYTTGKYFGGASGNNLDYIPIPMNQFKESLKNTIGIIERAGKTAYYVTENPELINHPIDCINRPFKQSSITCDVPKTIVESRHEEFFNMLKALNSKNIIQTIDIFCPNDTCISSINGDSLYIDYDHLSLLGSDLQASFITQHILH